MKSSSRRRQALGALLCIAFFAATGPSLAAVPNPQPIGNEDNWGLNRIDQKAWTNPGDGLYHHDLDGSGVIIYVVDQAAYLVTPTSEFAQPGDPTKNRMRHLGPFTSRCSAGIGGGGGGSGGGGGCVPGTVNCPDKNTTANQQDHGWHVAGIAGSLTFGVAKNAEMVSVPAICNDGQGNADDVAEALDAVLADYQARNAQYTPGFKLPAVVNMSITFSPDEENAKCTLKPKIKALIDAGMTVVVGSGNAGSDESCAKIPQQFAKFNNGATYTHPTCALYDGQSSYFAGVIGVGNSTKQDQRAVESNTGLCTDIYAPGTDIMSLSPSQQSGKDLGSGTSQAAPHVAGRVAQLLEVHPNLTPSQVEQYLVGTLAGSKSIENGSSPPRPMLYTGDADGGSRSPAGTTLSASPAGSASWTLSWTPVAGHTYRVFRADNPGFYQQRIVYDGAQTSIPTGVLPAGSHYFRLLSCDASLLNCRQYANLQGGPLVVQSGGGGGGGGAPAVPVLSESTGMGITYDGQYSLHWTSVAGATTYKLERSFSDTFNPTTEIYSGGALQKAESVNPNLTVIRWYRVRACNSSNVCSAFSPTVTVEVW